MKFWLTAAVAAALASDPASASDETTQRADKAVIQTMQSVFKAFETSDRVALARLTTPDFHIFERGHYLSLDQIFGALDELRKQGVAYEWNVTQPELQVHGPMATIAYVNQGAIIKGGVRTPTIWYESGTLLFNDDHWRVTLMQSEKVKPE